jgi:transcriptional regulator with XRE-family HTH domain
MPSASRLLEDAARRTRRQLAEVAEEFLERRLMLDLSQDHVAVASGMSRKHYGLIERGRAATLALAEMNAIASVLGLTSSVRLFPGGTPIRDRAHTTRLIEVLGWVVSPLRYRIEVPLPAVDGRWEQRAWDAMVFGGGARTAIELEMRLRDAQAAARRINLKRRDDPTERFLLLIADTRTNRTVLDQVAEAFGDLPRLRRQVVRSALESGSHPPSGILLI